MQKVKFNPSPLAMNKEQALQYSLDSNIAIYADHLSIVFDEGTKQEVQVLLDLDVKLEKGKTYFVIGDSGAGKSTLVTHFNGLLKSKYGNIFVENSKIIGQKKKINKVKKLRKSVGMVFQFPEYQLFKDTVVKDVMFGPLNLGVKKDKVKLQAIKDDFKKQQLELKQKYKKLISEADKKDIENLKAEYKNKKQDLKKSCDETITNSAVRKKDVARKLAEKYLIQMGLDQTFFKRSPFELSGGQKRRVAIAGILAMEPNILVFDEPTAGLDPIGAKEMLDIIESLRQQGKTIIVITHDMNHVLDIADKVILLGEKKILAFDEPYKIFYSDVINKTSIIKPRVIQMIDQLIKINPKFSKLIDFKPRNVTELALRINQLLGRKYE